MLDQSRIGAVLTGDAEALCGGPPVTAMLDPEHQPGVGRARAGAGQARLCARRPLRLRARAVHDRDGADGRHRAAGDHVPRARRHLSGRRPPVHPARAEADRAAGRMPHQPRRDLRACRAARRAASGLRHERRARSSTGRCRSRAAARSPSSKRKRWIDCQPDFRAARIISTASPGRTASSASSRTGRRCRSASHGAAGPGRRRCRRCPTIGT